MMSNASELLRRYVKEGCEGAFAELVREHINLVYSAALRETNGDEALAKDVSQAVFMELVRKSRRLLEHRSLAGWLYTTVRYVAANFRRAEQRRRCREEEAQSMREVLSEDSPEQEWQQIRPVLDDALHELNEADRTALVLRYLEDRSLREVGAVLGLQENSARMRVDRALEKLRGLLGRRGITSTTSSLAAALAVGVITPAPEALAAAIASTTLASGATVGTTSLIVMKLMSTTKLAVISALVVAGIAVPAWQQARLQKARTENLQLRAREVDQGDQETKLASMRTELERLRKVEADQAELERLRQTQPELLRLRAMAGVARRANADAQALRDKLARQQNEGATNPVSGAMADAMNLAMTQQAEGRLSRMTTSLNLTPEQAQAARDILMRQARAMSAGMQQTFSGKFDKEELSRLGKEAGNPDEAIKALLTPEQQNAYQGYQQEEAKYNAGLAANNELLQLHTMLGLNSDQQDRAFAGLYEVTYNQLTGKVKPPSSGSQAEIMQWTFDEKAKVLEPILTPAQLQIYRQQLAIQAKLARDILGKMQGTADTK
jgi:RNA polymerase sigma factor (sigma-70 family)